MICNQSVKHANKISINKQTRAGCPVKQELRVDKKQPIKSTDKHFRYLPKTRTIRGMFKDKIEFALAPYLGDNTIYSSCVTEVLELRLSQTLDRCRVVACLVLHKLPTCFGASSPQRTSGTVRY